jgi:hypothetical protein
MSNELNSLHDEIECDAYNAAFYELGLKWHWDPATCRRLQGGERLCHERLQQFLETAQPHLLKVYDAEFLANAIESRKSSFRSPNALHCNWAALQAGQIGA